MDLNGMTYSYSFINIPLSINNIIMKRPFALSDTSLLNSIYGKFTQRNIPNKFS